MPQVPSLVVLDTSVVSLLMRSDSKTVFYQNSLAGKRAVVSFQTLEEAWFGALKANWGEARRNRLARHLGQFEVVWPTPEMVRISAHLRTEREQAGRRLGMADAWVAAAAILLRCPLVSDDGDFEDIPNLYLVRAPTQQSLSAG